jgi:hypothetical protein
MKDYKNGEEESNEKIERLMGTSLREYIGLY